jgi:glycosyltransferase involved in cell wall biosynthesis
MSKSPQVSVVMTVWNGEKHIAESIDSILRQTFQDLELIVIDDGSTDDTCRVVETFQDSRLHLIRRPHSGIVSSANYGVSQARGTYVARLDADDISLPDRLALQVDALERNPQAVLCYTDAAIFGEGAAPLFKTVPVRRDPAILLIQMCFRCPVIHSTVLYRKSVFDQIGGYLDRYPVSEDFNLFIRLIRVGPFVGIPRILVNYRRHLGSISFHRLEEMKKFTQEICIDHMEYFLKVDATQAEEFYKMLWLAPGQRDWRCWLSFCARVLRHPACRGPESLAWMLVKMGRMVVRAKGIAS